MRGLLPILLLAAAASSQDVRPPDPPRVHVYAEEPIPKEVDFNKRKPQPATGQPFEIRRGVVRRTKTTSNGRTITHYYRTFDKRRRDGSWSLKDVKHGPYQRYFEGVLVMDGHYRDGEKTSLWTEYSHKGVKVRETIWIDGKKEGLERRWRYD